MDANETDPDLRAAVAAMMDAHWVPEGYCAPNAEVYPHQWLWDSCFHAIIWAELGDDRAAAELVTALGGQHDDGFVPHMRYLRRPDAHRDLWGRSHTSGITQPPMYGHAIAELGRRGVDVEDETLTRAVDGLRFLLRARARTAGGLVALCHPWESGADDSPRWDDLCPGGFDPARWRAHKSALVAGIETTASGSPARNPDFRVGSVGFNALVAFNARELCTLVDDDTLAAEADAIVDALHARWSPQLGTWIDDGDTAAGSGRVRTLDALLPLLVDDDPTRVASLAAQVVDAAHYGGEFGPAGVHRDEASYRPEVYWRGPSWPQLGYLMWVALGRAGETGPAGEVARSTRAGAARSGLAEYWHPDTGEGYGARPQSWAGLSIVLGA